MINELRWLYHLFIYKESALILYKNIQKHIDKHMFILYTYIARSDMNVQGI